MARYRPESESEPTFQTYEVPFRKDWVVLDALNYVKDKLDGSLSFRWSCRMGVCGSCGMTVNGNAEAHLRRLPRRTICRARSGWSRCGYFPVVRDLVVDITDFLTKLKKVKPWIIRDEEKPLAEGEYRQTPDQLDAYKQFSMCINCLLCYSACPIYGLEPALHRPRGHRPGPALQQRLAGPGVARSAWRFSPSTTACGSARSSGECTKVCPKNVDPAGAIQQYKLTSAVHWLRTLLSPGERDERPLARRTPRTTRSGIGIASRCGGG